MRPADINIGSTKRRLRLLPQLRRSIDLPPATSFQREPAVPPPTRVSRKLADGLEAVLMDVQVGHATDVTRDHLQEWEMTEAEAFAEALANLRRGVSLPEWSDRFISAGLCLPDVVRQMAKGDGCIVAVPTFDSLMVCRRPDTKGLHHFFNEITRLWSGSNSLSPVPYRMHGDNLYPLTLKVGDPLAACLRTMKLLAVMANYDAQRKAINDSTYPAPPSRYVCNAKPALNYKTGDLSTWTMWVVGNRTLIPRVDYLGVSKPVKPGSDELQFVAMGPWDRVRAVLGSHITAAGGSPELFVAEGFPGESQLKEIGIDHPFRHVAAAKARRA